MASPMGIPMGRPMGRPWHVPVLGFVSGWDTDGHPGRRLQRRGGRGPWPSRIKRILMYSFVFSCIQDPGSRILDSGSWEVPEPDPGLGPAQRARHTCMGLEV